MTDHRTPDQIEHDLANTRQHLEHTLGELQRRLDPSILTQRAVTEMRENGALFGRNLGATLRDNPLPAAMLGISVAWLMSGQGTGRHGPDAHALRQRGHDAAGAAKGSASGLAAGASATGQRASQAAGSTAAGMRAGLDAGRQRMAETGESMNRFYAGNPMAAGALAVAVGALAAALMPRGRMEEEALGPYRERARQALRERTDAAMREAEDRAGAAAEGAVQRMREKKDDVEHGARGDQGGDRGVDRDRQAAGPPQAGPSGPSGTPAQPTGSAPQAGHGPSGA